MQDQRLKRLKDKANKLPLSPGVYIMRDSHKEIIYIGKAKALKNRVTQYFGSQEKHLPKVRKSQHSLWMKHLLQQDKVFPEQS